MCRSYEGNLSLHYMHTKTETLIRNFRFFGADPSLPVASVSWTVDRKEVLLTRTEQEGLFLYILLLVILQFAVELLSLATIGVKRNLCSSFVLCGVAIPKLVRTRL